MENKKRSCKNKETNKKTKMRMAMRMEKWLHIAKNKIFHLNPYRLVRTWSTSAISCPFSGSIDLGCKVKLGLKPKFTELAASLMNKMLSPVLLFICIFKLKLRSHILKWAGLLLIKSREMCCFKQRKKICMNNTLAIEEGIGEQVLNNRDGFIQKKLYLNSVSILCL